MTDFLHDLWHWFAYTALDGAVGAALAAAVAWYAVRRTIRHERENLEMAELRAAVANLRGTLVRASLLKPSNPKSQGWQQWFTDFLPPTMEISGPADRTAPRLSDDIESFRDELADFLERTGSLKDWNIPPDEAQNLATALASRLRSWQADPDAYEAGEPTDWKAMLAELAEDDDPSATSDITR